MKPWHVTTIRRDAPRRRRRAGLAVGAVVGAVLALFVAGPALAATTMIAADAPTTVTLAPGATGTVPVTIKNTGAGMTGASSSPAPAGDGIVFTAPPNTTFPAQSTVGVQYSTDGATWINNALQTKNCVVSNAGKTLTCEPAGTGGGSWPTGGYYRFNPQITVDSSAPANTKLTGGSTLTWTDTSRNVQYQTSVGTSNIQTPAATGAPVVSLAGLGLVGGLSMVGGLVALRRRRSQTA